MKHVLTLMALVVAVTAGAQGTTIHEYPWNPDSDNDNLIGINDLLDFLPVFGDEFGNPPEPCDYDGTPLEELMAGIIVGDIVLDSVFIEYELEDVSSFFIPGCPEQVTDTVVFSNSMMLRDFSPSGAFWRINGNDAYGYFAWFELGYDLQMGSYKFTMRTASISALGFLVEGFFGGSQYGISSPSSIPFPDTWYLDEEGIHIESGWDEYNWPYYANYLHILPYWHYAE